MESQNVSARDRLMLVRLSLSQWSPRKFDRKASDKLAQLHGATSADEIGRFNKLIVDPESLRPLRDANRALRDYHYLTTAPWADDGVRVLPVELYFEYSERVRAAKAEIERLAREFAASEYPREREAARSRLNGLFSEADYPDAIVVEQSFGVRVAFEPLPNPQDARAWRIGQAAVEEIRADVERSVRETVVAAHRHVVDELERRAREFVEKVRKYQDGDTRGLRETAVENLREVVSTVLAGLNVTGDPALTRVAEDLDAALAGVTVEGLRHGETLRRGKIDEVEAIVARFAGVLGAAR